MNPVEWLLFAAAHKLLCDATVTYESSPLLLAAADAYDDFCHVAYVSSDPFRRWDV